METLPRALRGIIRHNRDRVAILDDERSFTWTEFGDRVARAAGLLAAHGIGVGDRYAIFARNGFRHEELRWAGHWLGAVPVPINWRFAPPEVAHVLADSDCKLVALEDVFADRIDAPELAPWRDKVLLVGSKVADGAANGAANGAAGASRPHYEAGLAGTEPAEPADPGPDDDAMLYYTGGTTGRSKGVRLSHRNILSNGVAFGFGMGARPDDVYLHAAPMFHTADLLATAWFLSGGGHCYLPAFSPAAFFDAVARHRVTMVTAVPTMLIMLVSDPAIEAADLSSLRALMYGSAPLDVEWIHKVAKAFPHVDLFNGYGLSETAPDLTLFDARAFRAAIESGDKAGPVRSVGKPNVLHEIKIVTANGEEAARGEAGEIWARGPSIMTGYLNLPKETGEALADGWLHTGDIGRVDEEGYVYILDRAKDTIITGAENVYSSEVEGALYKHPGVHECAVIGVHDEVMGEALFAVIVPAPSAELTEEALIDHCRPLIAGYKIPRRMAFVDALPKSAMGKILKSDLRKQYGG